MNKNYRNREPNLYWRIRGLEEKISRKILSTDTLFTEACALLLRLCLYKWPRRGKWTHISCVCWWPMLLLSIAWGSVTEADGLIVRWTASKAAALHGAERHAGESDSNPKWRSGPSVLLSSYHTQLDWQQMHSPLSKLLFVWNRLWFAGFRSRV